MSAPYYVVSNNGPNASISVADTASGYDADNLLLLEESLRWKAATGGIVEINLFVDQYDSFEGMWFLGDRDGLWGRLAEITLGDAPPVPQADLLSGWTLSGASATRTAWPSVTGPDGVSIPWKLEDANASEHHTLEWTQAIAADTATHSVEHWLKRGSLSETMVQLVETGGTLLLMNATLDWNGNDQNPAKPSWPTFDITPAPGYSAEVIDFDHNTGWARVRLEMQNNGTNTTLTTRIYPGGSNAASVGYVYAWGGYVDATADLIYDYVFAGALYQNNDVGFAPFKAPSSKPYALIRLTNWDRAYELANITMAERKPLPSLLEETFSNMETTGTQQVSSAGYYVGSTKKKSLRKHILKWPPIDQQSDKHGWLIDLRNDLIRDMKPMYFMSDGDDHRGYFCWGEDNPKFSVTRRNQNAGAYEVGQVILYSRETEIR
jgi:hypothetical protein